ncbi:MAG: hypothetical protein LC659_07575, partial [Myxococcales bacterium]|nr:hypothetical protein [Myxococcales bacterium]
GPRHAPLTMLLPPALLLVLGALLNFLPQARVVAAHAAGQLGDHGSYVALVLGGRGGEAASPLPASPTLLETLLPALAAIALATVTLARHRAPQSVRRFAAKAAHALWAPLRAVHTGHVGDQVAFVTLGAAAFAAACALLYR